MVRGKGHILLYLLLILAVLIVPYGIDRVMATGFLKRIPHYFSAEIWFAFLGSYIPGMVIGTITIIQAIIIQKNNQIIQELTYKQRFSVLEPISMERISPDSRNYLNLINKIQSVFGEGVGARIGDDRYYLLSFVLKNSSVYDLKGVSLKNIDWVINGQSLSTIKEEKYIQCYAKGDKHTLLVYVLFAYPDNDYGTNANKLIAQFLNNEWRGDIRFEKSSFSMGLLISDEIKENQELTIRLDLKHTDDKDIANGISFYAFMA